MLLSSPLGALISVVQSVRLQAINNHDLLKKNEAATRAALIDPILRALGWDTGNVRMVEPEHVVANKQKLDYLLKDNSGAVAIVIEAKCLHEQLDKLGHVGAAIGYAFSLKPNRFFITDGIQWHYYSPAHSQYHPFETINLQETEAAAAALCLISWLDAAHFGYFNQVGPIRDKLPNKQLVKEPEVPMVAAVKPKALKTGKETSTAVQDRFVDLAQVNRLQLQPGQKPTQLRLPDGSVKAINTWKDILLETCYFLLATNLNIQLPLPDRAGKKRHLLATQKPEIGSSTPTTYKGKTLFIYTHYSATDCIANALHALNQLPQQQGLQSLAVKI